MPEAGEMKKPLIALLFLFYTGLSQAETLVSVHPVALLMRSAWPGIDLYTLLPPGASPHHFSLKPSQVAQVKSATQVIWLGGGLEPYLSKLLHAQPGALALSPHADHHDAEHIWLDPAQVLPMLANIQQALQLPEPVKFKQDWLTLNARIKTELQAYRGAQIVVYHPALEAWLAYYQLPLSDVITQDPEQPVGSRHLALLAARFQAGQVQCLISEPEANRGIEEKLLQGSKTRRMQFDPMAYRQTDFLGFYAAIADDLSICLQH
jgi:zinc transport system substrate-binding protein